MFLFDLSRRPACKCLETSWSVDNREVVIHGQWKQVLFFKQSETCQFWYRLFSLMVMQLASWNDFWLFVRCIKWSWMSYEYAGNRLEVLKTGRDWNDYVMKADRRVHYEATHPLLAKKLADEKFVTCRVILQNSCIESMLGIIYLPSRLYGSCDDMCVTHLTFSISCIIVPPWQQSTYGSTFLHKFTLFSKNVPNLPWFFVQTF